MTEAEARLWRHLRDRQLAGLKFVRQEPIGRYYADFVCRERHLIIELDGSQHADSAHDKIRDTQLARLGYRVLRVWNNEVFLNIEGVLMTVRAELDDAPHPNPLPASGEREHAGVLASPLPAGGEREAEAEPRTGEGPLPQVGRQLISPRPGHRVKEHRLGSTP